jgi:hypothetical protein
MSVLSVLRQQMVNVVSDERQIEILRRALAGTEDVKTLHALALVTSELAATAVESCLGAVADLQDRIHEKLEHLGLPPSVPKRPPAFTNSSLAMPAIEMRISAWQLDEFGNQCRTISNASDPSP